MNMAQAPQAEAQTWDYTVVPGSKRPNAPI